MLDLPSLVSSARRELGVAAPVAAAPITPAREPHAPRATLPGSDQVELVGPALTRDLFNNGAALGASLASRPLPATLMDSRIDLQGTHRELPAQAAGPASASIMRGANGAPTAELAANPAPRHDAISETVEGLGGTFRPAMQALTDVANGTRNVIGNVVASRSDQQAAASELGSIYADAIPEGATALPRAPRVEGNNVSLLVRNANYLPRLYEDLDAAQRSITINQFNWEPDGSGARVFDTLMKKASQGLDVRVIMDGYGINERGKDTANNMQVALQRAGVKFVRTDGLKLGGNGWEHRKLITIDDNVTYTGGLGFGKKYDTWTDMMLRIQGPAASVAAGTQLATFRTLSGQADDKLLARAAVIGDNLRDAAHGVRHLTSGPPRSGRLSDANAAVTLLDNQPGVDLAATEAFLRDAAAAKHRFWATSTYLTTNVAKQALIDAARRGVDVKLVTTGPEANNDGKNIALGRAMFPELLDAGVELYEYPTILHGKSWVRDEDVAAVGSMNLSKSSMARARELTARVEDPGFAASYAKFHEEARAGAHRLTKADVDSMGLKALNVLNRIGLQF